MDPVCPTGCLENTPPPAFEFDFCAPVTHAGEVSEIWLTKKGNPLTGANTAALLTELNTRMAALDDTKIVRLYGVGDKPAPTINEVTMSRGRKQIVSRDHVVNFDIDETNDANYEGMRQVQCGVAYTAWYLTSDNEHFYGGKEGIDASINMHEIIARERNTPMVISATLSWSNKFSPERLVNPLA